MEPSTKPTDVTRRRALRLLLQGRLPTSDENRTSPLVPQGDLADSPRHHLVQVDVIGVSVSDFTSTLMNLDQTIGPRGPERTTLSIL